jgi:hypothetical protein
MKMIEKQRLITIRNIERNILNIRGRRVLIDHDLAILYCVTLKRLNEQVKRNESRFPEDFMFQLTKEEWTTLRSQNATLKQGRGTHRKYMPFVFTEHGTVMLANILRSDMAIKASIEIVRVFVRLRELSLNYQDLTNKINKMEQKYDNQFRFVFDAIRELMNPPSSKNRRIGFVNDKSG